MIPVFYRPEQSCDDAVRVSPSAGKPALVMADWRSNSSISNHIEVNSFEPASTQAFYAAHSRTYVDGILSCQRANGFGSKSQNIAASLRYTTGSMIAAATHVLSNKVVGFNVAVSPTSGFHHAGYSDGGGFCTFNGLMATAIHVHSLGLAKKILIVDMDQHYGDGTIQQQQYDLVLYQAGADIHVDDPLGGLLTTDQMKQRDISIFSNCARLQIPLVWNLAGGYQRDDKGGIEPVLALHRNTMLVCIGEFSRG